MDGGRADDDPRMEKTMEFPFLCPKLSVLEAMWAEKITEEESIIPWFKMRVRRCVNPKKKSPPIDIVSLEMDAPTLAAYPKIIFLN